MLIFVRQITLTEIVQKKINVIFVISGVIASFWKVFIKFRWHGQKLIVGTPSETKLYWTLAKKVICHILMR